MSAEESKQTAAAIAAELQAAILQPALLNKLQELREATVLSMCEIAILGTAEEVSTAIGNHHLLRGRKQAFEELIDNHNDAMTQISA